MWLIYWQSHWVVQSESGLFGWCYTTYFLREIRRWEESNSVLLATRRWTTCPFMILHTRCAFMFSDELEYWTSIDSVLFLDFWDFTHTVCFWVRVWIAIQCGIQSDQSDLIPHWFEGSVSVLCVWLEVKHTYERLLCRVLLIIYNYSVREVIIYFI